MVRWFSREATMKKIAIGALGLIMCGLGGEANAQGLFGPGKFKVDHSVSDTRFEKDNLERFLSKNNRITKLVPCGHGAFNLDYSGLYLDPAIVKDISTSKMSSIFFVIHYEDSTSSSIETPLTGIQTI